MNNTPIRPNFNNIPAELRARPQWVVWKYGKLNANGKRAKLPIDAKTGTAASTTNPNTWTTFEQARAAYQAGRDYTGIGFVLTQDDPFTFIDIDGCIRNGELAPAAVATVKRFDSYAEGSVSGTGIHVLVCGRAVNRKVEPHECYSHSRFVALTGAIICDQRTIQPRQDVLDAWHRETFPPITERPTAPTTHTGPVAIDDGALLDLIYNSKQGAKFASLMAGDTSGYKSHSEADGALCSMLAFWTDHDPAQIDRLFRQSGLMRPKWDRTGDSATNRTVGQLTVDNAIRQVRNGYRPPKNESSRVEQTCDAWRAHYATRPLHSATQRVLLATLRKFQDADTLTTYISSRNVSDLTGLSHKAAMMHLRLLCPQTRAARLKRLQADLNRVDAQLRAAGSATTPEEMLLTIRPPERAGILAKCGDQGGAAIMAEVMIFLTNRRDRATKEIVFYNTHPALDILDVTEAHAGSAFATVFTLRMPANSAKSSHIVPIITVGGDTLHSDHDLCGNFLQSSQRDALRFIEGEMQDDAFVVVPPARRDPRLKLEPDPVKRARLAKLLDVDAKLQPFGLSTPRLFAYLTAHPGATVDDLVMATGLGERTVRNVLKNTGPALVEGGHLPLVEAQKQGRKHAYTLAEDWRDRLDALRPDLATNGVVAARAVYHAGERIRRIDKFLDQGMRDHRHRLDEATRAQYEVIRQRAQQLQARILGREVPTAAVQPDALALSNELVTVEKAIVEALALAPALTRPQRQSLQVIADLVQPGTTFDAFPWHQLRYQHAQAVRAKLAESYAAATGNRHLSALRGVLKECWRLGGMSAEDYQRATDLKAIKGTKAAQGEKGRHLRQGEFSALIGVCLDGTKAGVRDACLIAVGYVCGLRRAELAGLTLADYDQDEGTLKIAKGKGNKERIVPLAEGAREALADWLDIRGEGAGPLFTVVRKGDHVALAPLTAQTVYDVLARRAEQAHVKKFSPHDLRRTFAGDLLDAGADLATVQKLMGHANANTTAGYDRRDAKAKKAAVNKLHVPYRRQT